MKAENEIIDEVLELYEFHKSESDKFGKILGILRGTPDDNKVKPPVPSQAESKTLPPPTELKASQSKPKKINAKIEYRECKDPRCKKKFVPIRKNQVYCSKECSDRGSVYLNYLNKKQTKLISDGKVSKEEKVDPVLIDDEELIEKHTSSKNHKLLKEGSFYNGATTMP
jgi:hypothetical protein